MTSANRSPEIRKDAINNRFVILSPARSRRPSDFKSKSKPDPNPTQSKNCPFCPGNEHDCAPEIFRSPENSSSDWKVRVIENLYPALSRDDEKVKPECCVVNGDVSIGGFGFHDVIIESPVHSVRLQDLEPGEVGCVLLAYKKRIQQLCGVDGISYVQV